METKNILLRYGGVSIVYVQSIKKRPIAILTSRENVSSS